MEGGSQDAADAAAANDEDALSALCFLCHAPSRSESVAVLTLQKSPACARAGYGGVLNWFPKWHIGAPINR